MKTKYKVVDTLITIFLGLMILLAVMESFGCASSECAPEDCIIQYETIESDGSTITREICVCPKVEQ